MTSALYDHDLERAVLGAIVYLSCGDFGPARLAVEQHPLTADDFHIPAHWDAWSTAVRLLREGKPADPLTFAEALKGTATFEALGGASGIMALDSASALGSASLPAWVSALRAMGMRRRMLSAAKALAAAAQDAGRAPEEGVAEGAKALASITSSAAALRTGQDFLSDIMDKLDANTRGEADPVIPTGIEALDKVISGLQHSVLTVIGARPGVGKSALGATLAVNLVRRGLRVGYHSREDAGAWIAWRLLAQESGIPQPVLRFRRLHQTQMEAAAAATGRLWQPLANLWVDDRPGLTPAEVAASQRDMVLNHGCQVLIGDHLEELRYPDTHGERHDIEIANAMRELRDVAKSYNVPSVWFSQLNRKADDGTPSYSWFKNSSAIEEVARVAAILTRDAGDGRLMVWILKQTNGVAGVRVSLDFEGAAALVRCDGGRVLESDEET